MDSSASHIQRKECSERDTLSKEVEACGPVYRGGDCSYSACVYTSDHYHCQVCGLSTSELSQAVAHILTSPACCRDPAQLQYPSCSAGMTTDAANSLYNTIYSGLSAPATFPPSGFSGYSQMDSFQWHPSIQVDKVAICSSQLSPCCGTSGSGRVQVDGQLCSPLGDLYSKVTAPMKELVSLPAKSGGTSMDSQAWFAAYNSQQIQKPVYKYPDQNSLPQINFLLQDPSEQKHSEMSVLSAPDNSMSISSTYTVKTDYSKTDISGRDLLKESFCAYGAQSLTGIALPEDASSLFSIQLADESLKQADIYHSHQQSLLPQMSRSVSSSTLDKKSSKSDSISNSARLLSRFTQEHYGNCMSSCSMYPAMMMPEKDPDRIDDNSNHTSSSASDSDESDIIVEDTGDELGAEITESEISIEDIKCSLLQGVVSSEEDQLTAAQRQNSYGSKVTIEKDKSRKEAEIEVEVVKDLKTTTEKPIAACSSTTQCSVCSISVSVATPDSYFIEMTNDLPLTTFSQIPVLSKLTQVVCRDVTNFLDVYGCFICRQCVSLVESVDSLEIKLESAKHSLNTMFKACSKSNDSHHVKLVVDLIDHSHSPLIELPLSDVTKEIKSPVNVTAAVQTVESLFQEDNGRVHPCHSAQESVHQPHAKSPANDVEKTVYLALSSVSLTSVEKTVSSRVTSASDSNTGSCEKPEAIPHMAQNGGPPSNDVHQLPSNENPGPLEHTESLLQQEQLHHHLIREEEHPQLHDSVLTLQPQRDTLVQELGKGKEQCDEPFQQFQQENGSEHLPVELSEKNVTKQFCFYCDRCGKGFMTRSGLEGHVPEHDKTEAHLLCDVCGKRFLQQKRLDKHMCRHRRTIRAHCEVCGKDFASTTVLTVHLRTHTGERPFCCSHCGRGFAHRSNLTAHENICSGYMPFHCDKCSQTFSQQSYLDRHIQTVHEGRILLQCNLCGKGFNKASDLSAHQRVHSMDRAYACEVCGRHYKSIGNLNHHSKSHLAKKPFTCELCNQGFLRKEGLEAHVNIHKGEKPFKCSQCLKSFWSKANLATHIKWHNGTLKKNTCPVCNKTFSQKLSVHMRTHTGARPYTCPACNHSFSTKSSLNKHTLLKHKTNSS